MPSPTFTPPSDEEVEEAVNRLDSLLQRIESMPGDDGDTARDAVSLLAQVYGEALARTVAVAAADAEAARRLAADQLVGHLMALHGLHPEPVEQRVGQAIAEMHSLLGDDGSLQLQGIAGGVATVAVPSGGSGSQSLPSSVRDIVLAAAPDLDDVRAVPAPAPPTFIPFDAIGRKRAQ
jgi:hypothetical protein